MTPAEIVWWMHCCMFVLRIKCEWNKQSDIERQRMATWQKEEVRLCIMANYNIRSNSMEHSLTLETLTGQEIPRILWKPMFHYRIQTARHLSLPCARSIQSMSPSDLWKIHLNIILPSTLRLKVVSFPQVSPPKTFTHLSYKLYVLHATPISKLCPRSLWMFCNMVSCYGEKLLPPRPAPKVEDHPWLSANVY